MKCSRWFIAVVAAVVGLSVAPISNSPAAAVTPTPVGATAGALVFADEFDGTSLDRTKWGTCYAWGSCINAGNTGDFANASCNAANHVSEGGGHLVLRVSADPSTCNGFSKPYTAGMVQSRPSLNRTYGFFEIRARFPDNAVTPGMWPAFWFAPTDLSWPLEIDVLENFGNPANAGKVTQTYHYTSSGQSSTEYFFPNGGKISGWHTYGVDWRAGKIRWLVDGVVTKTYASSNVSNVKMYLMINLETRQKYITGAGLPATAHIDYVRAWA
jgi:beta-glucanase (GH16 family)